MILILGGTTEGRIAARTLEEAGKPFYYSTKGDEQEVTMSVSSSEWVVYCFSFSNSVPFCHSDSKV